MAACGVLVAPLLGLLQDARGVDERRDGAKAFHREALVQLQGAAQDAHTNYTGAVETNLKMWP